MPDHEYSVRVEWTGNLGTGTSGYRDYSRDHDVRGATADLPVIRGSADPAFRGDARRWNPEQLLLASGGTGEFTSVTPRPEVAIAPGNDPESAAMLHDRAAEYCFIARSVNFPVHHEVIITTEH